MIDKVLLERTVKDAIKDTDLFIVSVEVNTDNQIVVEIDSTAGVDIDTCASITRKIEAVFDRDKEDYSLEVGSAGLTAPFRVVEQYLKNVGKEIELLTADGLKMHGVLASVDAGAGSFVIEVPTKVKAPGAKRPTVELIPHTLEMARCKYVKHVLNFK